ncbi:MAG: dynamin, partial [Symploca sp. SIO1A3]|nr:dynamin [Symploca sp. SIO1A3]
SLGLGNTFESDFLRYQPEIRFMDIMNQSRRQAFEAALKQAFENYINDKIAAWSILAEHEMNGAFAELSQIAANYGADYAKVTGRITEKLTGHKVQAGNLSSTEQDSSPSWAKWAMGLFSLASGNLAGVALAGAGFDWKDILLNMIAVMGIGGIITAIAGGIMGPVVLALLSLGVGALQMDKARQELVKAARKELVKYLPQVAQEQWQPIHDAIKECFANYEQEVIERVNDDIQSRKAELDNLLQQKESREINRGAELARLRQLETDVSSTSRNIDTVYQDFLVAVA